VIEDFPPFVTPDDVNMTPRGCGGDDCPSDIENDLGKVPGPPRVEKLESFPHTRPGDVRSIPRDSMAITYDYPQTELMRQPNKRFPCVPEDDIPFLNPEHLHSVPQLSNLR
jgi:hypothetical protein